MAEFFKKIIFKKAKSFWGADIQLNMLVEELGELIVAIMHYKRHNRPETIDDIKEEIADVTLMLDQIRFMLEIKDSDINEIITEKLTRTFKRLQMEEKLAKQ